MEHDLTKQTKVMIECGERFGEEGKRYLRVNCACPRSILSEGLRRIAGYLNSTVSDRD